MRIIKEFARLMDALQERVQDWNQQAVWIKIISKNYRSKLLAWKQMPYDEVLRLILF
jgi:hypothetical protein